LALKTNVTEEDCDKAGWAPVQWSRWREQVNAPFRKEGLQV